MFISCYLSSSGTCVHRSCPYQSWYFNIYVQNVYIHSLLLVIFFDFFFVAVGQINIVWLWDINPWVVDVYLLS